MKKIIIISILCIVTIATFAQRKKTYDMLDGWTFDKDTTVYFKATQGYDWLIQFQVNDSLEGTIDGKLKFKHKIQGMNNLEFIEEDSTNAIFDIDIYNYHHAWRMIDDFIADTLAVQLIQNNITGGSVTMKINLVPVR